MNLSLILLLITSSLHDFHMAKTEVTINQEKQRYEITQFVFLDDLQEALTLNGNPQLNLCTPNEVDSSDVYILDYLQDRFIISADNQVLDTAHWVGKEISDDLAGVYIYYALSSDDVTPKQLNIKNTIFTEIFNDQKNLVYLTYADGTKDYLMLDNQDTEEEIVR